MSDPVPPRKGVNVAAIPTPQGAPYPYLFNEDHTERNLITDVWADNLEEEFVKIREVVRTHPYVAMDTEFPGVVLRVRPTNPLDYQYMNLRVNVNMLKIIQLGLTFSDQQGNLPPVGASTWQFNFRFVLLEDPYAEDSITLLKQSGIDFHLFERRGIDPQHFAELMLSSGICLTDHVTWLSFHSGYDFGYLIRMLTGRDLPEDEDEFHRLLRVLFGTVLDTKYLLKHTNGLSHTVGLNVLSEDLGVLRIGPPHQAGSDSLLTWATYFKMVADHFGGSIDEARYGNVLYGLGADASAPTAASLALIIPGATPHARNVPQQVNIGGNTVPHTVPPAEEDVAAAQQLLREQVGAPVRSVVISERPETPPAVGPAPRGGP